MDYLQGLLFMTIVIPLIYLLFMWYTQPKYEDGKYVCVSERIRKIYERLFKGGDMS